ncbi:MAG: sigma-54 dependent transcriptional regulator [Candidatus Binatia bacterium]
MSARVLVVDDDQAMCEFLSGELLEKGFEPHSRLSGAEALDALAVAEFDVVVSDLNMPQMSGLALCERLAVDHPHVPIIVLTAFGSIETAVAAIRAGAYDFLTKPVEIEALALALERAVQHRRLRDEVSRLRSVVAATQQYDELVGASSVMQRVYRLLDDIAESDASVLISGESGTGKELVARALHRRGRRSDGPFVAMNCAAIPEALLESELFGHTRGAFTDARNARTGLFVRADGGTLFLDEIGELPLELQPKLLRALQERTVSPLGADAEVAFDVRLITATNRDLELAIEERRFREDLYFRVNVVHVEVPPLRARGSDVLLLAQRFVERFAARSEKRSAGISPAAAELLLAYAWPGNVRELQNCIERAVALTRSDEIAAADLPEKIRTYRPSHVLVTTDDPSDLVPMEEVERRYILRVMEAVGGSKSMAARVLGFDRRTLYRKLERYGYGVTASEK